MAQQVNRLSTIAVKALTRPGVYPDGNGLYLQVRSETTRSWVFRYTLAGKARWMGLGSADAVTLKEARERRDGVRQSLRKGVDPLAVKEIEKAAKTAAAVKAVTFVDAVDSYLNDHTKNWRNPKHRQQWRNTLDTYALPAIGPLPVAEITASHVVDLLRPLWVTKHETARRVRGRIESVLDYAASPDDIGFRNPAELTARLRKALPQLPKGNKPQHHAALPYVEIGAFMADLRQREGIAARALEFVILTATRTSETLLAQWSEFDLGARLWTIPPERMKAGKLHRVPLSDAAVAVLAAMGAIRQNDYIFPGQKTGKPLSNMALLAVLARLGYPKLTVHGFRSTFRDWTSEKAGVPREIAEACLAHTIKDKTERAYKRGDLLERRRAVMEQWAQYCGEHLGGADVVPLRKAV